MYELLYKYLILNQKLGLPGVGSFYIESIPAKMDIVAGTLTAPKKVVNFNKESTTVDRAFYDYLISELNLNETEVIQKLNGFGQQVKQAAQQNGISLPGIGMLKIAYQGDLTFYPETKYGNLLPIINLNASLASGSNPAAVVDSVETKIIIQNTTSPEKVELRLQSKEDYWWVYAIALALVGLGALLFHYIN
jgi:hypothetical protein